MLRGRLRTLIPGLIAILAIFAVYVMVGNPAQAGEASQTAAKYSFTEMPIAMPPGYDQQKMNTVRVVNPAYRKIRSWMSAVGASVAINDLTGHGRADSMCLVDTRTNDVVVTYTPTAPASDRFTPFVLDPAPLPVDHTMAPTGCMIGDFTGDGRNGLLVFYWGRTPILFLPKAKAGTVAPGSYTRQEVVAGVDAEGRYVGPRWNTDAVAIADLAGTGHPSLVVGNYFPDSAILDPHGQNNMQMPDSLSNANNGGGLHLLRWVGATSGESPSVHYVEDRGAVPFHDSAGWTLALATADLTGDGKPEVYVGNDFGHGHLLYNRSTANRLSFTEARGRRTPGTPKSFVLGNGSFKGMGVDFADMNRKGHFDFMVSNITQPWGLEESNFYFVNKTSSTAEMAKKLSSGTAPFSQQASEAGLAWSGWAWDVKLGDFLNDGNQEAVQALGFLQGTIDRWPWMQEMATMNDDLLSNPAMWPNFQPGDDVSGHQVFAFFAKNSSGKYVNISKELGFGDDTPSRGIALADTTGSGHLDFAVARQWGPPSFYANKASVGNALTLNLYRPSTDGRANTGLEGPGTPAYGTTVTVRAPGQTQISQLDGGSGHDGYRSFQVRFGLGSYDGPVTATVQWHDNNGAPHRQDITLKPGNHTLILTDSVQEGSKS
ncbi:ASPIC/UnbV domain-containing protein [Streptomyces sp. NPDC001796]|uniref:ASPIC/UnbV domain-containing protein n=1 Tax=Streptomyces sp. NPDC001796 TaxID=3364609 RepID=UPI0036C38F3E